MKLRCNHCGEEIESGIAPPICPECNGEGSVEGKTGGSEGIPEADVLFVCQYCNGTGKASTND